MSEQFTGNKDAWPLTGRSYMGPQFLPPIRRPEEFYPYYLGFDHADLQRAVITEHSDIFYCQLQRGPNPQSSEPDGTDSNVCTSALDSTTGRSTSYSEQAINENTRVCSTEVRFPLPSADFPEGELTITCSQTYTLGQDPEIVTVICYPDGSQQTFEGNCRCSITDQRYYWFNLLFGKGLIE